MPGWRRLVLLVAGILVAVALIGSLLIAWPVIVLPVVLFVVFGVQSLGIQGAWADRLLSPALARAAADLGTPTLTNQWRITGTKAAQLGNELRHLTRLPPPAWPDGRAPTAAEVERYYIAAAGPIMRRYLQPVLTAEEHRDEPLRMVDQRDQYTPGAPWPVLHPEEHQWDQPRTHPPTT